MPLARDEPLLVPSASASAWAWRAATVDWGRKKWPRVVPAVWRAKPAHTDPVKWAGPATAYDRIIAHGRRGLSVQRFKGLGEMNPDQLWQTTLDPSIRTLLQVKVNHADDADDMFSRLMGDLVEPRREFIQDNALDAEVDV